MKGVFWLIERHELMEEQGVVPHGSLRFALELMGQSWDTRA
jgi:hypothetical protein